MRRRLPLRAIAAAVAVATVALAAAELRWLQRSADRSVGLGLADPVADGQPLYAVAAGGPAERAGLRPGDVLLRVGGVAVPDEAAYDAQAQRFRRGEPVVFELRRGEQRLALPVTPGAPFPWQRLLADQLKALAYLATGLLALRLGTGYLNSSLLFVLCSAVALQCLLPVDVIGEPLVGVLVGIAFHAAVAVKSATELHLALLVPERLAALRRRRWRWVVPSLYAAWSGVAFLSAVALLGDEGILRWPITETATSEAVYGFVVPLGAFGVLFVLGARAVAYPEREGRTQAAIVLLGSLPWVAGELVKAALAAAGRSEPQWLAAADDPLLSLAYPAAILWVIARTARRRERLLLDLSSRVEELATPAEVARVVAGELQAALHTAWVQVYDGSDGEPTLSHTAGRPGTTPGAAPPLFALAEAVGRERRLLDAAATAALPLPAEERGWLARSATEMVVPLAGPGLRLSGMLLLGPKKSEEPYTARERRLLAAFARQVATAWENLLLRGEVDAGRRREREVLAQLGDRQVELVRECPRCGRCYDGHEATCSRDGAELAVVVPVERVVAGRYRLERLLGRGGMGAAYEASDLRLRRSVAVKVLLPGRFGDPQARRRFEREARLLARLRHRHLVAVHDSGETGTGGAFLVMERLEGMSLQATLERYGAVAPEHAAGWVDQLLDGLAAVHREGIVHRDLKPANVFLARTGEGAVDVKLLDFGIAKDERGGLGSVDSLTLPGAFVGTLPYMSPEQVTGEEVDARSDLFTCGVLVYEMLTGRRPFDGPNPNGVSWAILNREVHLPGDDPAVVVLDGVLAGLLAKKPWQRFASAAEVRPRLVAALQACPPLPAQSVDAGPPTLPRLPT